MVWAGYSTTTKDKAGPWANNKVGGHMHIGVRGGTVIVIHKQRVGTTSVQRTWLAWGDLARKEPKEYTPKPTLFLPSVLLLLLTIDKTNLKPEGVKGQENSSRQVSQGRDGAGEGGRVI